MPFMFKMQKGRDREGFIENNVQIKEDFLVHCYTQGDHRKQLCAAHFEARGLSAFTINN